MERERWRGDPQPVGDAAGGDARGPRLHEQTEYRQARVLRQCGKGGHCRFCFHVSNNIEILFGCQGHTRRRPFLLGNDQRFAGPHAREANGDLLAIQRAAPLHDARKRRLRRITRLRKIRAVVRAPRILPRLRSAHDGAARRDQVAEVEPVVPAQVVGPVARTCGQRPRRRAPPQSRPASASARARLAASRTMPASSHIVAYSRSRMPSMSPGPPARNGASARAIAASIACGIRRMQRAFAQRPTPPSHRPQCRRKPSSSRHRCRRAGSRRGRRPNPRRRRTARATRSCNRQRIPCRPSCSARSARPRRVRPPDRSRNRHSARPCP